MLRGVLEAQAPPKQYASDTISTYSSRLQSATLLEDRREAIQGLRSFAKEYPASVASEGLRGLISSLTRDVSDVDTGKIVLETLIALFNPDANSPEADDDIALWVADQFSQRQDNITVLLDMLENDDYYARLLSLRLLGEICSARPERTQECILSAPLGTARLVSMLDDARDAIRAAGLYLLNEVLSVVTSWSFELQKIIAFEDAFDRIFNLISAEGSLFQGGIVVQDCLNLLANLLRFNASNQSLFREARVLSRLASLFEEEDEEDANDEAVFGPNENKEKNIWGVLAVLRMFLAEGSKTIAASQTAFANNGIFKIILNLSFTSTIRAPIRAEALKTCAEIIKGNERLQERFANNQVPAPSLVASPTSPTANGDAHMSRPGSRAASRQQKGTAQGTVYVMEALLDLILKSTSIAMFDVRMAATDCISAYFYDYKPARHHFLRHAINLHHAESGSDNASSNAITVLLAGPHGFPRNDPYRIWFAAILALRLIYDDVEAKAILRAVSEGDESKGEELVTAIQLIAGHIIEAYQENEDDRVIIAYLQLLCAWLFEDSESVADFLSEGSTVQELMKIASKPTQNHDLAQGLAASLLGIVYEFSTKDCPIPRRSVLPLIEENVGREQYRARMTALRTQSQLRDFEVLPQNLASVPGPGLLPEVYFDGTFVEFLKDNFSRLVKAIEKDPGLEIVQQKEGVDRDLVDQLRGQIEEKESSLKKVRADLEGLESRLASAQGEHHKASEGLQAEVRRLGSEIARIKNVNDSLQRGHEAEMDQLRTRHKTELASATTQSERQMKTLRDQHARALNDADASARQKISAAEGSLRAQISSLEQKVSSLERSLQQERQKNEGVQATLARNLDTIKQRDETLKQREDEVKAKDANISKLNQQFQDHESKLQSLRKEAEAASQKQASAERDAAARVIEVEGQLETVREELRRKLDEAARKHDNKEKSIKQEHEKWTSRLEAKSAEKDKKLEEHRAESESLKKELDPLKKEHASLSKEVERHKKDLSELKKGGEKHSKELEAVKKEADQAKKELESAKRNHEKHKKEMEQKLKESEAKKATASKSSDGDKKVKQLEKEVKDKEEARSSAQSELDDLLIVLGDVEEKRARDKVGHILFRVVSIRWADCSDCRPNSRSLVLKYLMMRTTMRKTKTKRTTMKQKMKRKPEMKMRQARSKLKRKASTRKRPRKRRSKQRRSRARVLIARASRGRARLSLPKATPKRCLMRTDISARAV